MEKDTPSTPTLNKYYKTSKRVIVELNNDYLCQDDFMSNDYHCKYSS